MHNILNYLKKNLKKYKNILNFIIQLLALSAIHITIDWDTITKDAVL